MNPKIQSIIDNLKLEPHPEGGYFKETYRAEGIINLDSLNLEYTGERNYSTCIYFLLISGNFSAFHQIHQDEIWHFYDGSPIMLHMIDEHGKYTKVMIGKDFANGEVPQFVVPGGVWFASEVSVADSYSLAGCTVSPGFDFDDFHMAESIQLSNDFPQHIPIIERLTR